MCLDCDGLILLAAYFGLGFRTLRGWFSDEFAFVIFMYDEICCYCELFVVLCERLSFACSFVVFLGLLLV